MERGKSIKGLSFILQCVSGSDPTAEPLQSKEFLPQSKAFLKVKVKVIREKINATSQEVFSAKITTNAVSLPAL